MDVGNLISVGLQLINFVGHKRSIQSDSAIFDMYLTVREDHEDELTVTRHPVEQGASISDHAFKEPATLSLELGWSQSGKLLGVLGLGQDYPAQVYKQLLGLQASRSFLTITTAKRRYKNMMFTKLGTTTDASTENSLIVRASFQEVITVQTLTVAVPPSQNMALPQQTGATQPGGMKQLAPAPSVNQSALSSLFGN